MNWFNKIKELTDKKDSSPELKKGEVKQILIQTAIEVLPDFKFLVYKNSSYTFQRLRQVNDLKVYETLHIIFTLKNRYFACSIASRLNPDYIFNNQYSTGLLNPHIDLKVLQHNSGDLKIKDAYYYHNGRVETTSKIIKEIFEDFLNYGISFLDQQIKRIKTNEIIQEGLNFVDNLYIDKVNLKKEITKELNQAGFVISRIKHPLYIDLKYKLQSVRGQSKGDRQLIPKTTLELLEIYWTS